MMKKQLLFVAVAFSLSGVAQASEIVNVLMAHNGAACLGCHAPDKKMTGPSFNEIKSKYQSDAGAVANLVEKVTKGGKGAWGEIPMPPNAHMKKEDIEAIVKAIMH